MAGTGGVAVAGSSSCGRSRNRCSGESRFYNPPPMRRKQERELQQRQQQRQQLQQKSHVISEKSSYPVASDKRPESSSSTVPSDCSCSSPCLSERSNLDRFLAYTAPVVRAQHSTKSSMRGWRTCQTELHPYFILGDLWESFQEWSAFGAGVPLVLNGRDKVVQYYVPYLSGIQLYIDPSKASTQLRRQSEGSDSESARETSSDSSSSYGHESGISRACHGKWSQCNTTDAGTVELQRNTSKNVPLLGSSSDGIERCNSPGQLIFEYLEHAPPFSREPLADKILDLTPRFPELRTYRSCDLSPSSWISVAWYPIYRIPIGTTLQNLDASFLTFHSLSMPSQSTGDQAMQLGARGGNLSSKLLLSTFGLASYKFNLSVWNTDSVFESQKANSLLSAADNWLRLLSVNHPDYNFFIAHNASRR